METKDGSHPTCGAAGRSGAQGKSSRDVRIGPDLSGPARLLLRQEILTNSPVAAEVIIASHTWTTVAPWVIVTMSDSLPSTASRKFSCSVRSGSGFGIANQVTSPSATPRKLAISSHTVATLALE